MPKQFPVEDRTQEHLGNCTNCHVSWRAGPIPEDQQYAGGPSHYSRRVAEYDFHRDCTVGWRCPDCGHFVPRDQREIEVLTDPRFRKPGERPQ